MKTTEARNFGTRRFWTDNASLGLATVAAGIFNTAYSVLLAHALGPAYYGRIGALNNLVSLFLLPLPIVALAAIRFGRQADRQGSLLWGTLGLGAAIFVVVVALSPALAIQFHLPAPLIILYSASVVWNFGYALYVGYLQRARRYRVVGAILVLASASAVAGVGLAVTLGRTHPLMWLGFWQALAPFGLFVLSRRLARAVPLLPPSRLRPEVVATTLGVGTLQALWGFTDVLFAKAHLSTVQAGLYTGLSTIGQALPFVVASLSTVMLTAILDEPEQRRAYLARTLAATGFLAVLFVGVLVVFPVPVVRLALGFAFIPMSHLVERYGAATAAMALVLVLTTYGVAMGHYRTMAAAAVGTGIWIVALIGAHTMVTLVDRTAAAMGGTLVLVVVVFGLGRELRRTHE